MKSLTLNQKRFVAAIWLGVFLFALGNEYFEWGILGTSAKGFRLIVMGIGLVGFLKFGPRLHEELEALEAANREAEDITERARDKSNDAVETERLRRAIGMPSDSSPERTRDD